LALRLAVGVVGISADSLTTDEAAAAGVAASKEELK
jgi:hypothetical protein